MKFNDYLNKKLQTDSELNKIYNTYDLYFEVGELITQARIYKNITQAELAKLIGTRQSSVSRIESGKSLPNLSLLNKIAKAVGTYLVAPRFGFMYDVNLNDKSSNTQTTNDVSFSFPSSGWMWNSNINQNMSGLKIVNGNHA